MARQRIHHRVLERVAHVQRAGDIRRRDHDAVRLAGAGRRVAALLFPTVPPARFDVARLECLVHGALLIVRIRALVQRARGNYFTGLAQAPRDGRSATAVGAVADLDGDDLAGIARNHHHLIAVRAGADDGARSARAAHEARLLRSEEHTSELQSLIRTSY